ncbi:MAG: ATP synthase F0 subunit C [Planctomycetales bacterium]
MYRFTQVVGLAFAALFVMAAPAAAQQPIGGTSIAFSGAFGAGLVTMGAAYGIGRLAAAAFESMARQPEVKGQLFTSLIVAAALIEGFTFFALIVCLLQK